MKLKSLDEVVAGRGQDFKELVAKEQEVINAIDDLINQLRVALEESGLSKAEIAREVGVQPAAIRRMLTAKNQNPTLKSLIAVASVLGLQLKLESS